MASVLADNRVEEMLLSLHEGDRCSTQPRVWVPTWRLHPTTGLSTSIAVTVIPAARCSPRPQRPAAGHKASSGPRLLINFFNFLAEFDLLEIRLREMASAVDCFVLSESNATHSGQTKPLFYQERGEQELRERGLEHLAHRIIHVAVTNMPMGPGVSTWTREGFQRDEGLRVALGRIKAHPDDWLLHSDADEIVRGEALVQARACAEFRLPGTFVLAHHQYRFSWRRQSDWHNPFVFTVRMLEDAMPAELISLNFVAGHAHKVYYAGSRQRWSNLSFGTWSRWPIAEGDWGSGLRSGWHFTYFGTQAEIRRKMSSFAHTELNTLDWNSSDWLSTVVGSGQDIFGRDRLSSRSRLLYQTETTLKAQLPQCVFKHYDRMGALFAPRPSKSTVYFDLLHVSGGPFALMLEFGGVPPPQKVLEFCEHHGVIAVDCEDLGYMVLMRAQCTFGELWGMPEASAKRA